MIKIIVVFVGQTVAAAAAARAGVDPMPAMSHDNDNARKAG